METVSVHALNTTWTRSIFEHLRTKLNSFMCTSVCVDKSLHIRHVKSIYVETLCLNSLRWEKAPIISECSTCTMKQYNPLVRYKRKQVIQICWIQKVFFLFLINWTKIYANISRTRFKLKYIMSYSWVSGFGICGEARSLDQSA